MQAHLQGQNQDVVVISETEAGNLGEVGGEPASIAQQPPQPARGVATRRRRREEQEYQPPQVGIWQALACMSLLRLYRLVTHPFITPASRLMTFRFFFIVAAGMIEACRTSWQDCASCKLHHIMPALAVCNLKKCSCRERAAAAALASRVSLTMTLASHTAERPFLELKELNCALKEGRASSMHFKHMRVSQGWRSKRKP